MTGRPATRFRALAARIDAATPPHRDRTVDALRALAILGVILGHWLVTALVVTSGRTGTTVHDNSPLAAMPALTPVSWIFQTLAIFFLVGGYAAARSYSGGYAAWVRKRLVRLSRPVAALTAVWTLLATGLYLGGVSGSTLHTVLTLVLDPLWFLGVFVVLTALTPLAVGLVRRLGAWAASIPLLVVASVDLVRFGLGGPSWVGWINVLAGWMVPYLLGIAWARGAFRGWKVPALMLAGGVAATAALVLWAGYPASMVGVNGARISNLNPPTLAVVTFGIAQVGLALLLRPLLARWMRRPVAWAVVAMANLSAMTLFLWHQTAFLAVTMGGLLIGRLPGLHTAPAGYLWVAERLAWLPVFAVALAVLWVVFRRAERGLSGPASRHGRPAAPARPRSGTRSRGERNDPSMLRNTTTQTASASHASSLPSVASQETCRALPSSPLATPYMPTGKTMLHSAGS
jgi:fucose 4-O-acetylase-like acetyltransferase